jgi:2-polyprenyl-3-methyl-5-hydroxy-6-metoxy-1,4-benzoquinol methylase
LAELFRRERPEVALAWTGERFVTETDGDGRIGDGRIEIEHLHRYFVAREFCRAKHVLDVASGEGYGSALLAQTAGRVIGVEVDPVTVEHASSTYQHSNLQYVQGDAVCLPLDAGSVDVVVSFETLEHFFDQEAFLKEVKRVLTPGGFLLISTPDANVYSGSGTPPNPFHRRELTGSEFLAQLHAEFRNVSLLRQRVIVGSAILPEAPTSAASETWCFERRDASTFEAAKQLQRAPYLLAVASNGENPPIGASIYVETDELPATAAQNLRAELQPIIAQATADAATAREEAKAATEECVRRLQIAEDGFREQVAAAREETEAIRQQVKTSAILEQQQELVMQRLRRDLSWRAQKHQEAASQHEKANEQLALELEAAKQELARFAEAYREISHLIIPVWMRKSLPTGLKNPLRAIKRALRNG